MSCLNMFVYFCPKETLQSNGIYLERQVENARDLRN